MIVELEDYNLKDKILTQNAILDKIANQSRSRNPTYGSGLFKRTIEYGHESIQEFAFYIFHIQGFSRAGLLELTRHRIASYNVVSGRHVEPEAFTTPKGFLQASGEIQFKGARMSWFIGGSGLITTTYEILENDKVKLVDRKDFPYPLEDVRLGYPSGTQIDLFMGINGRSLRNFLKLRLDQYAHWEIRELASKMYDLVLKINPLLLITEKQTPNKSIKELREQNE